jgi:general secretion pathway protein H
VSVWLRPRTGGFTLIELVIVFTLLATLAAVLAPLLLPSPKRTLDRAAAEVTTTLRETRRLAQAAQARRRFVIDTASGRYGVEHTSEWRSLPQGIDAALTTARSLITGENRGGIDFFPDGSSTGGRVQLGTEGHLVKVDIEWLTGRIRVQGGQQP